MNKDELLENITRLAAQRAISPAELEQAYNDGVNSAASAMAPDQSLTHKIGIGEILSFIGGAIVFIGICVLIFQHWTELSIFTKILVSFGSGLVAYIVGALLIRIEKAVVVAQSFFLISALVLPIGIGVVMDNAGMDVNGSGAQALIAVVMLLTFLLSFFLYRKNIFIIFTVIFSTWLFFAFTSLIVGGNPVWNAHFFEYRTLITGLSYMLLGYAFANGNLRGFTSWLYTFGVGLFLGAAMALGGYSPNASAFWEILFVGLVFGVIFLSVYLKSRAFLILGAFYLMIYVLKITSEYFSESLGWSFALIISGLALIAIGYFAYHLNKKYISQRND